MTLTFHYFYDRLSQFVRRQYEKTSFLPVLCLIAFVMAVRSPVSSSAEVAAKCPTPGTMTFLCPLHHGGVRGDGAGEAEAIHGFLDRNQVAGAVVNDGNHSNPLVLGSMPASRRSRQQAARSARANALNSDSILW